MFIVRVLLLLSVPLYSYASAYCDTVTSTDIFSNIMSGCAVSIFEPSNKDISLIFLRVLFGTVGDALTSPSNPVIMQVFYLFNSAIITVTSSIIGYSTLLTVVVTSQEGSIMGSSSKGILNPWIAARSIGGASLLIPSFNGYSAIQVLVMYIIVQGVGFADTLWTTALSYIKDTGNPIVSVSVDNTFANMQTIVTNSPSTDAPTSINPTVNGTTAYFIDNLYQSSLCWAANSLAYPMADCTSQCLSNLSSSSNCLSDNNSQTACSLTFTASNNTTNLQFPYQCGNYSFSFPQTSQTDTGTAVMENAISELSTLFMNTAQGQLQAAFININAQVQNGTYSATPTSSSYIYTTLDSALGGCTSGYCIPAMTYASGASQYVQAANFSYQAANANNPALAWTENAMNQGWITAGMYYFNIASMYSNGSSQFFSTAPQKGISDISSYIAQTVNTVTPPSIPQSPPVTQATSYLTAWTYLTQFTLNPIVAHSANFTWDCNDPNTNESVACAAGTLIASLSTPPIQTGSTNSVADALYRNLLQQVFTLLKKIDQYKYTNLLPNNISAGFLQLSPCTLIMPIARFYRLALGGTIRVLMGLNIDFWEPIYDKNPYSGDQCNFDGGLRKQVVSVIKNSSSTCGTSIAESCISDINNCTSSNIQSCLVGQTGFFPVLFAGSNGGYIDPIYGTSRIGIKMMAIAAEYWSSVSSDVMNQVIKASWTLFGISLPIQMASDVIIANAAGNTIVSGILGYTIGQASLQVMKVFLELSKAVLEMYLPLGTSMASIIFGTGALLGLYIPFIPFTLYLFGIIGWFIAVIEAMIAAPLVALSMTHPEGHDVLGKAEQATILLLGVFVRPATMILGIIFAMNLAQIALQLLDYSFLFVFNQLTTSNTSFDVLSTGVLSLGALIVYTYLLLTIIEQSYSLIYQLPDKILRWIGGHPDASTSGQQAKQLKEQIQKSSGKAGESGSRTAGHSGSAAKSETAGSSKFRGTSTNQASSTK